MRQRDPLITFVALLNRAVFWFHPLAWWLQRRISTLSEQACDAAVMSRGHDADVYAASLLRFAKSIAAGGRRISVGTAMPGADLSNRLRLLAIPPAPSASAARLTSLLATYVATAAICSAATPATIHVAPEESGRTEGQSAAAGVSGGEWRRHATPHFDIFYEEDLEVWVDSVSRQAEAAYQQLSADFKYDLTKRVPLVVVRSNSDLQVDRKRAELSSSADGQRLVISLEYLNTRAGVLLHELTHQFLFEIVPETSRRAPWQAEGLAEYARGLWDADDYRMTREAATRGSFPGLDAVDAADRYWGHALFDFVAARYGVEGIRRVLFALRTRSQVSDAISTAAGLPAAQFEQDFQTYVVRRFGGR